MGLGLGLSRGLATLLAVAGTETGASATSRTVALLHDTGQMNLLLADPGLMDGAVREGLRISASAASRFSMFVRLQREIGAGRTTLDRHASRLLRIV